MSAQTGPRVLGLDFGTTNSVAAFSLGGNEPQLIEFAAPDNAGASINDLVDPARIDDVVFAQGYPSGEAPCVARWSALAADLPISVPGYQLDRRCGSGLQSIIDAAMFVQTGAADVVVAGGVESMTNVEYYSTDMRSGARAGSVTMHDRLQRGRVMSQPISRFGVITGMIETAENLAKDYQIGREECDEYAARSQQRAAAAWKAGKFDNELVPVAVPQKKGDPVIFKMDEGVRGDSTLAKLANDSPKYASLAAAKARWLKG